MVKTLIFAAIVASAFVSNAAQKTDCPDGWTPYDRNCYKLFRDTVDKSYDQSQMECSKNGAQLAEVETAGELDFLGEVLVGDLSSYQWTQLPRIGGRRRNAQDGFRANFVRGLYTSWCHTTYPNNYQADPQSKDRSTCLYLSRPVWYSTEDKTKKICVDDDYCELNTGFPTITRGYTWICKKPL